MKITEFKKHYRDSFPVGPGWRPLIEKLVDDITKLDPTVEITQIKEKFGTLRFYIAGGQDEVYDLIEKAEMESGKICEECGTQDEVTTEGGWVLTLCKKCRETRRKGL